MKKCNSAERDIGGIKGKQGAHLLQGERHMYQSSRGSS